MPGGARAGASRGRAAPRDVVERKALRRPGWWAPSRRMCSSTRSMVSFGSMPLTRRMSIVAVDSFVNLRELAEVAQARARILPVVIEVDIAWDELVEGNHENY